MNANPTTQQNETVNIKYSKSTTHRETQRIVDIRFDDWRLTSFVGLAVCQSLFWTSSGVRGWPASHWTSVAGSELSTSRCCEGTAVGLNGLKEGQRSYHPLFCTIAQTTVRVLDVWHRPWAHSLRRE